MSAQNGGKAFLLALLASVAIALSGWALVTTVAHGERITRTEANVANVTDALNRIEHKVDRILERP